MLGFAVILAIGGIVGIIFNGNPVQVIGLIFCLLLAYAIGRSVGREEGFKTGYNEGQEERIATDEFRKKIAMLMKPLPTTGNVAGTEQED